MTSFDPSSDPVASLLTQHGMPRIGDVADDIAGTYLRIADMMGVRNATASAPRRAAAAATADLHRDLAALAAVAGDACSLREHALTAARLAAEGDDLAAMMAMDAQLSAPPPKDAIYAVYDLSHGPVTFDFTHFLALAERFRQLSGKLGLYVIFVPAPGDGFRRGSPHDRFLSRDRKLWRLANLLAHCAYLVPNCVGTAICHSREDAGALLGTLSEDAIFPPLYALDTPSCPYQLPKVLEQTASGAEMRTFRAPPLAADLVRRWFHEMAGTKPIVSITLRQSDFRPERNSNFAAWRQFAEMSAAQGFHPVIIPDTEALLAGAQEHFAGFSVLDLPALSVGYRMAIYQESFVSAMVNSGPHGLCLYHPTARHLVFKILNPSVPTCTAAYLSSQGMPPHRQLPLSGPHQKMIWEFDEFESIERAFIGLVEAVLAEPAGAPLAAVG